MKCERLRISFFIGLMIVVSLPCVSGCATNPPPNGKAPEIPPTSTFVIDFGDFAGGTTNKVREGSLDQTTAQTVPGSNWGFAALNVGVWSTIVSVTLAIPVASFVESFNHEPTQQPDGSWSWTYDVTVGATTYTAELQARTAGADIEWTMLISKEGSYTDFNWFSGVSNLVGSEGSWTLNRDPNDPTPFITIAWSRALTDDVVNVRYTNVVPDGSENGGYIDYAVTEGAFDAAFELFNKGKNNVTRIEWDRTGKDGRVKDEVQYGDMNWHCWDENLLNADCP